MNNYGPELAINLKLAVTCFVRSFLLCLYGDRWFHVWMNEDLLNYAFLAPLLASPYWGQFVLVQISIASSQISSLSSFVTFCLAVFQKNKMWKSDTKSLLNNWPAKLIKNILVLFLQYISMHTLVLRIIIGTISYLSRDSSMCSPCTCPTKVEPWRMGQWMCSISRKVKRQTLKLLTSQIKSISLQSSH